MKVAVSDPGKLPAAVVPAQTIKIPGPVTAAPAKALMPGMHLPKNITVIISYDPACQDSSCIESFLSARHCQGKQYVYWFRRGDGLEQLVENVAGAGCP